MPNFPSMAGRYSSQRALTQATITHTQLKCGFYACTGGKELTARPGRRHNMIDEENKRHTEMVFQNVLK